MTDTDWKLKAACDVRRDGELWYAPEGEEAPARKARVRNAKRICGGCPVARECATASANERFGIWAGINVARPGADPAKIVTRKPQTAQTRKNITEANQAAADRKFEAFVERVTILHQSGLTYDELLVELAISNVNLRRRLRRRNRMDLYSMLTGAAT